jgi:predicted RNA binding protein YcfA (HicA-like mRNA interferase family)
MGKIQISRKNGFEEEKTFLELEEYTTLREFITSVEFLKITTFNPNRIACWVNNEPAEDDLLLVPGDTIQIDVPSQKALIGNREIIKKLKILVGLEFVRHGGSHDVWKTSGGKRIPFPRHARDMKPGTLRNILKQAEIEMSLDEFVSTKL